MERTCKRCRAPFHIHEDEKQFLTEKIGFTFSDTIIRPPLPVYCPDCRCQIRTCHRNERNMTKVTSGFSGKEIVSIYHDVMPTRMVDGTLKQGDPIAIYEQEEWRGDGWNALESGKDVDFEKPFFEQFAALQKSVPRMALITVNNENSGFTTGTGYCRNCYLINSSENCEDCYYGKLLQRCKDSVDCSYLYDSELCYECFSCYDCYSCQYLSFGQNCNDCFFSTNLKSCKNCCLCWNLTNKEYHFLNEPLSKEEYEKRLQEFRGHYDLHIKMRTMMHEKMTNITRKYSNVLNIENCTGDYIENARNCLDCYDVNGSEDCRYVQVGVEVKDNYDCSNMYLKPEVCYETLGTINVTNCAYCLFVFDSNDLLYCDYCFNCKDCFGCTGLMRQQYCIFNKQYSKEEYEALVPKIIAHMQKTGEWGLYFPPQYAPFGYNETLAYEYYPLEKEEALKRGFAWRDPDARDYKPQTAAYPKTVQDMGEEITQEVFACEICQKNYRIIPQEMKFYSTHQIPVPHKCPDCRHRERMQLRNPRTLFQRPCMGCQTTVDSTYAPDRPERILCEPCYQKEIFE